MKRVIAAILLFALWVPVFAQEPQQEPRWTVRTSAGYIPSVPTLVSIFGAMAVGVAVGLSSDSNQKVDVSIPPYLGVDAMYSFNSRWSAGVSTGYTGSVMRVVDKETGAVNSTNFVHFVPLTAVGRYNYLNRPSVKLYGSLEAGGLLSFGNDIQLTYNFQVNPIGVEYGNKFFGMAELGVGMNYFGGRIGLGYRF